MAAVSNEPMTKQTYYLDHVQNSANKVKSQTTKADPLEEVAVAQAVSESIAQLLYRIHSFWLILPVNIVVIFMTSVRFPGVLVI